MRNFKNIDLYIMNYIIKVVIMLNLLYLISIIGIN